MAFVFAGDFKNGLTFDMDGSVMQIVEFQHVKPGKGAAFVRTKIKNVVTGAVLERVFNPTEKFPLAYIDKRDMQYTYEEGNLRYFMDSESYDMIPIDIGDLNDNFRFVKEGMKVKVLSYNGKIFGVEVPNFVVLEVTNTEPGVRGDTATNATKMATLETGAEIRVPLFVNEGDLVKIDTRTGEYMERKKA